MRYQLALVVTLMLCVAGLAGCAWLNKTQPKVEAAIEKVEPAIPHSLAVLQCASFVQRMAFDSGKRLGDAAALAFCAALEASPDVNPAPTSPSRAPTPENL